MAWIFILVYCFAIPRKDKVQCKVLDAKVRDLTGWEKDMQPLAKRYLRFCVYNELLTDERRAALRQARSKEWREAAASTPDQARAGLSTDQLRRARVLWGEQHAPKKVTTHGDFVGSPFCYLVNCAQTAGPAHGWMPHPRAGGTLQCDVAAR